MILGIIGVLGSSISPISLEFFGTVTSVALGVALLSCLLLARWGDTSWWTTLLVIFSVGLAGFSFLLAADQGSEWVFTPIMVSPASVIVSYIYLAVKNR